MLHFREIPLDLSELSHRLQLCNDNHIPLGVMQGERLCERLTLAQWAALIEKPLTYYLRNAQAQERYRCFNNTQRVFPEGPSELYSKIWGVFQSVQYAPDLFFGGLDEKIGAIVQALPEDRLKSLLANIRGERRAQKLQSLLSYMVREREIITTGSRWPEIKKLRDQCCQELQGYAEPGSNLEEDGEVTYVIAANEHELSPNEFALLYRLLEIKNQDVSVDLLNKKQIPNDRLSTVLLQMSALNTAGSPVIAFCRLFLNKKFFSQLYFQAIPTLVDWHNSACDQEFAIKELCPIGVVIDRVIVCNVEDKRRMIGRDQAELSKWFEHCNTIVIKSLSILGDLYNSIRNQQDTLYQEAYGQLKKLCLQQLKTKGLQYLKKKGAEGNLPETLLEVLAPFPVNTTTILDELIEDCAIRRFRREPIVQPYVQKPMRLKPTQKSQNEDFTFSSEMKERRFESTAIKETRRVDISNLRCDYNDDARVVRWMECDPNKPLDPELFPEYVGQSFEDHQQAIAYHGFPKEVDDYFRYAIRIQQKHHQTGEIECLEILPVEISFQGRIKRGVLVGCIDRHGIRYHRCFSPMQNQMDLVQKLVRRRFAAADFPELEKAVKAGKSSVIKRTPDIRVMRDSLFRITTMIDERNHSEIKIFEGT